MAEPADIHADLTLASIAAAGTWLPQFHGTPMVEFLQHLALLLAKRAQLRVRSYEIEGFHEEIAALKSARKAAFNLRSVLGDTPVIDANVIDKKPLDKLSSRHRAVANEFMTALETQSTALAEIAAQAARLHELIDAFHAGLGAAPYPSQAEALRHEFISAAKDAWIILTGSPPRKSRRGPFVRFAAAMWIAGDLDDLGEDPAAKLGPTIERLV